MRILVGLASLAVIGLVLVDAFEAVLLPRRVTHNYRLTRLFYRLNWRGWRRLAALGSTPRMRETLLSLFGPLSMLTLFGTWAVGLIFSFGCLHWSLQTPWTASNDGPRIQSYLYFSGETFFTLGYGELTPASALGRLLAVCEAGLGFGFLALVLSYYPVLGQAFSRRETTISLLDARGGSPPSAAQILIRCKRSEQAQRLNTFLVEWEVWCAELLESCLSFPVLAYYRSQHDNQSWLAALTAILDTCALEICGLSDSDRYQARLTFAIARHAAVDLCLVFKIMPVAPDPDRLTPEKLDSLIGELKKNEIHFPEAGQAKLADLRAMYEPFINGLSKYLLFRLPDFIPEKLTADNWQTSAWMPRTPALRDLADLERGDHFV